MAQRKLSKTMRKMNRAYKVIMALLAGVSLMLATLTDTDAIYYKFVSVFSSAFPVVWSQVLDACKNYESEEIPTTLSPASTSVRFAEPKESQIPFSERNTPKSEAPVSGRDAYVPTPKLDDLNDANENTV